MMARSLMSKAPARWLATLAGLATLLITGMAAAAEVLVMVAGKSRQVMGPPSGEPNAAVKCSKCRARRPMPQ